MYVLSNLFFIKNNLFLNLKINFSQFTWYFNSLLYQFWISFLGAILLIYTLLIFLKNFYFIDWINLEIYIFFLKNFNINNENFYIFLNFLPLVFGLLLKLGLLPFFFWKPEIYKNFSLDVLFLYVTSYAFSVIFFFIFFVTNYLYLINFFIFYYLYYIVIISLVFLPLFFYSITEVRVFLAYSSIFHILITIISFFYNNYFLNSTFIYLFIYIYYIFFFIILLFCISNFNLWYLSEFQIFFKHNLINIILINLFLGMSGIPPFLGFFSKIMVVTLLLYNENYLLFSIFLISGLIISFYYIQNYRFFGYNLKNINYYYKLFIIVNYKYLNWLIIFTFFNIFSIFFFNDIYIYSFLPKIS